VVMINSGEGLTMVEIREIGRAHGILSLEKFNRKDDLIRTIQLAQGHSECFKRDSTCSKQKCQWINECHAD
jgi:hypothetical protein